MDIQGISASQIFTVGIFLVGLICIQIFIKKNKNKDINDNPFNVLSQLNLK